MNHSLIPVLSTVLSAFPRDTDTSRLHLQVRDHPHSAPPAYAIKVLPTTSTTETFNVQEATANLPGLLQAVISRRDVIIADEGKPLARFSRVEESRPKIHFGVLKGKIKVSDDFDAPLPESILSEFE